MGAGPAILLGFVYVVVPIQLTLLKLIFTASVVQLTIPYTTSPQINRKQAQHHRSRSHHHYLNSLLIVIFFNLYLLEIFNGLAHGFCHILKQLATQLIILVGFYLYLTIINCIYSF